MADITSSTLHLIHECDVIIITVNSSETSSCASKLSEILENYKNIPIFSFQRGVKNSMNFKSK